MNYIRNHAGQIISILALFAILSISVLLNFYNLGSYPFNPDESVYSAQAAIWAGHDSYKDNFLLFSRSATNFQVHQVFVGAFFKLFGVSEYVARLPSAIFGVLTVLLIFVLADTLFNRRTALLSSFFAATNNYLIHFNRQDHLEATLILFLMISTLLFVKWHKTKKDYYFYSFLLSTLIMVMIKVIILLPFGILVIYLLYTEGEYKNFITMLTKPLSIIIILLTLVYTFYYIYWIVGIDNYINTLTYAVGRQSKQYSTFYIDVVILFMGYAIPTLAILGILSAAQTRNKEDIFISIWAISVVLFFTYYPLQGYSYVLPAVPAVAMLCARVFDRLMNSVKVPIPILIVLLLAIPASTQSSMYYPYNTLSSVSNMDISIIDRFDPIRYIAIEDAASWLHSNVDKNSGILVYTFADQHNMAYYSGLRTYTVKNYPGFYMPVNGTAKIIWDPVDSYSLIKSGDIDYVFFTEETNISKNLVSLNKNDGIKYDLVYYKSYITPSWYLGGSLNVSIFKITRPKIAEMNKINASSFSIVALSDTQSYALNNPYIFKSQVQWMKDNKDNLNIKFFIHLGDVTQSGKLTGEFDTIVNISDTLNGIIPYMVAIGNHDYNDIPSRDSSTFDTYFSYEKYKNYSWFGGNYPSNGSKNTYALFSASGEDFLVMGLDMCPTDDDLNWSNGVIGSYPNRKVILYTHSYLNNGGARHTAACYSLGVVGNEGEDMWTKLVKNHDNIIMVLSGHNFGSAEKVDYINSMPITQILADYEGLENGGDGYLRLYTFTPSARRVDVYTYSPYLNTYLQSANDQFSFTYGK